MFLIAILLAVAPVYASCPADATALSGDVATAAKAYDDWDWEAFDQGVAAVVEDLGCLSEVVPGPAAKAAHRLFALAGARKQDAVQAKAGFRGMLAIEPGYVPELSIAPEGSLLRKAWADASAEGPAPARPLPAGAWFVDGKPGAQSFPVGRTAVVQLLSSAGGFVSWYLDGQSIPADLKEQVAAGTAIAERAETLGTAPSPKKVRAEGAGSWVKISGMVSLAAGLGTLAVAEWVLEPKWQDAGLSSADREAPFSTALNATYAGVGLTAIGGSLLATAVFTGTW